MLIIDGTAFQQATFNLRRHKLNWQRLLTLINSPPDRVFIGRTLPKNEGFLNILANHQIEFVADNRFFHDSRDEPLRFRHTGLIAYQLGQLDEGQAFVLTDDYNLYPVITAAKATNNLHITLIYWSGLLRSRWTKHLLTKEVTFIDLAQEQGILG